MLIDSLAGLLTVRRRTVVLRFRHAMGEPLFGGAVFGLAACGALAGDPQIDDLSHAKPQCLASAFRAKCADTVAGGRGALTLMQLLC
jgi:hypothetical protein